MAISLPGVEPREPLMWKEEQMSIPILTSIPVLFDKPINVWLGIALVLVVILQIGSGIVLSKGKLPILPLHRLTALLLAAVVAVHAFYGIGYWFFDFKIG